MLSLSEPTSTRRGSRAALAGIRLGTLDANSVTRFRNIEAASGDEFFRECGSLVLMDCGIAARTESMCSAAETRVSESNDLLVQSSTFIRGA